MPQQPPDHSVLFIVPLDVMPKIIVWLRRRARSAVDGQYFLVDCSLRDVVGGEGRPEVGLLPIRRHQVHWILIHSLSASHCLTLQDYSANAGLHPNIHHTFIRL